jgi:hypothetical protein
MAKRQPLLETGDVIKTHPREGYWGCAVVLNSREKTVEFGPQCLIGITPIIIHHDFSWAEIADSQMAILEFDRGIRLAPGEYGSRHETCIGIYLAKPNPTLPVIANVVPPRVFSGPLTFEVGDGTNGRWPLCGKVPAHLGMEAVIAWRQIHDHASWLAEMEQARASYEVLEKKTREGERQRRKLRKSRSGT